MGSDPYAAQGQSYSEAPPDPQQAAIIDKKSDPWYTCWGILHGSTEDAMRRMRLVNVCNALLLMVCGVLMMIQPNLYVGFQFGILAVNFYLCCGGLTLCCFELRVNTILIPLRRNCGFLFQYTGRFLMLLVLGTFMMSVALFLPAGWNVLYGIVAACTMLNALFNACVIYRHPGISAGGDISQAEHFAKGADTLATQAGAQYVANNPELATKAMEHGVQYAQNNPEQAASMAQSAMAASAGGGGYGSAGGGTAGNPFGGQQVANAW